MLVILRIASILSLPPLSSPLLSRYPLTYSIGRPLNLPSTIYLPPFPSALFFFTDFYKKKSKKNSKNQRQIIDFLLGEIGIFFYQLKKKKEYKDWFYIAF